MTYRFIDPDGREVSVEDTSGIRRAIQEGRLRPDSLMFQPETGRWAAASGHPAYRRVVDTVKMPQGEDQARTHSPPPEDVIPETQSAPLHSAPTDAEPDQLKWLQRLALAGVFLIGFLSVEARASDPAGLIGGIFGFFLGSALFAGVFLIWSHRTRRYLPFGMLAVALLVIVGGQSERNQVSTTGGQLDELEALVDRWEEEYGLTRAMGGGTPGSGGASVQTSGPPASGSMDERALWAGLRLLEAIEEIVLEYEVKHEIGEEHLEGWLEPQYLANASEYSAIPAYFNRNRAFLQQVIDSFEADVVSRMDEVLDQAGLSSRLREEFQRSFLQELRVNSLENSGSADLQLGFLDTAEELHEVLLANEHLIQVSPTTGRAEIWDVELEERVLNLLGDLEWYLSQVAEIQDEMMQNMRNVLAEGQDAL